MHQFRFDVRDLFKSPRLGLSLQRMWIQFLGLFVGMLGYIIFTYVSLLSAGISLEISWRKYGLLPCLFGESAPWYSFIIYFLGAAWLVVLYLVTATAVSRASYMLVKGNNFYTWREAFSFAKKKVVSVVLTPVALAILIGLFLLGGAIVGWLADLIPYVGEFGLTILTPIWFIAALVTVFLVLVVVVSAFQTPAIIATTDDDAFEAVFQSFSLLWSQPWRLILYAVISGALALAAFFILALLSKQAFILMDRLFANTMGDDFINISAHGMYLLSVWVMHSIGWVQSVFSDFSGLIYFSREFDPLPLPGYMVVVSHIFSVWILLIGGFIASYGVATLNIGNTISYLILRKKKDDENLLDRKDREEEEDEEEQDNAPSDTETEPEKSAE
ncbi:MAG TPA: hypothetical protein ENN22_10385 [bacterium]|nr:hypothetical protein [bacterium]